jgi:quercetin dioxygenase-like cupin family protein
MKTFKLINTPDKLCTFLEGSVPEFEHISTTHFFVQKHIENYEKHPHPAPRYQFVVTLKGKLRFTVSDGSTFIIEPGVLLIANDLEGPGHTWELIEGDEWLRVYIVPEAGATDHFVELKK